jgi:hypothetical protein
MECVIGLCTIAALMIHFAIVRPVLRRAGII